MMQQKFRKTIFLCFSDYFFLFFFKSCLQHPVVVFAGNESMDQVLSALLANNMFMGAFSALVLDNVIPGINISEITLLFSVCNTCIYLQPLILNYHMQLDTRYFHVPINIY